MHILENHSSLKARSSKLRLIAKGIADGMKVGNFRSVYHGQGIEFSGVREYLQGDDIRNLDWNVTARMGKPFVKTFDEEKELVIFIILDRSLSMMTGSRGKTKLEVASETVALLTLAAEQNNCPTGAVFFDNKTQFSTPPKSGKDHSMLIYTKLDSLPPKTGKGSSLQNALRASQKILKRRALVFVISDFRTTGYEADLARLAQKHDVVALCCTDRTDIELPEVGCIPFVDVETTKVKLLPTSHPVFKRAWRKSYEDRMEKWKSICAKRGVTPQVISTADSPAAVLTRFFSIRNKV